MNDIFLLVFVGSAIVMQTVNGKKGVCREISCSGTCTVSGAKLITSIDEHSLGCFRLWSFTNYGIKSDTEIWTSGLCSTITVCYIPVKTSTTRTSTTDVISSTSTPLSTETVRVADNETVTGKLLQSNSSTTVSNGVTSAKQSEDGADNEKVTEKSLPSNSNPTVSAATDENKSIGITSAQQRKNDVRVVKIAVPAAVGAILLIVVIGVVVVCRKRLCCYKRSQNENKKKSNVLNENDISGPGNGNVSVDMDLVQYSETHNDTYTSSWTGKNSIYSMAGEASFQNEGIKDEGERAYGCLEENPVTPVVKPSVHNYENVKDSDSSSVSGVHIQNLDDQYDRLNQLKTEVNTDTEHNAYDHFGCGPDSYDTVQRLPINTNSTPEGYAVWKSD